MTPTKSPQDTMVSQRGSPLVLDLQVPFDQDCIGDASAGREWQCQCLGHSPEPAFHSAGGKVQRVRLRLGRARPKGQRLRTDRARLTDSRKPKPRLAPVGSKHRLHFGIASAMNASGAAPALSLYSLKLSPSRQVAKVFRHHARTASACIRL